MPQRGHADDCDDARLQAGRLHYDQRPLSTQMISMLNELEPLLRLQAAVRADRRRRRTLPRPAVLLLLFLPVATVWCLGWAHISTLGAVSVMLAIGCGSSRSSLISVAGARE